MYFTISYICLIHLIFLLFHFFLLIIINVIIFFSFFLVWSIFLMSFFFFYHPFYIECFMNLIVILTTCLHYITIFLHDIYTYCIGRLFLFYLTSFVAVFYIFICISLFLQLYLSNFDVLVSIKYSYLLFFHFIYNVFVSYISCCIYIVIFLLTFVFHVNIFT